MAEEQDILQAETPPPDGEAAEDSEAADEEEKGSEGKQEEGKLGRAVSLLRGLIPYLKKYRKWFLLPLSGLALIPIIWGLMLGFDWISQVGRGMSAPPLEAAVPDHLVEEALPPFFIPLPPAASNRLVVVNFSIIWDGVAAIRYRKRALEIREYIYTRLVKLALKEKDIKEKTRKLESEMKRIFQESLGRDGIEVKVKELKAF